MAAVEPDDDEKLIVKTITDEKPNENELEVSLKEHKKPKDHDTVSSNIVNAIIKEPTRKYATYKLNVVSPDEKKWTIYRRYSDFVLLNKKLKSLFPNLELKLPPKRYFRNNFSEDFIMERQHGLEAFISNVFALKQLYRSTPVQQFFRLDNPPDVNEDLELCQEYCTGLEKVTKDLKQLVKCQGMEITQMKQEIEALEQIQNKSNADNSQMVSGLLADKQRLEKQVASVTLAIEAKNREMQSVREKFKELEQFAAEVRETERIKQEREINEQKRIFIGKQREIDQMFNDISLDLAELGKIKINVGGHNIDLKPVENICEKEKKLRRVLSECQTELEKLYMQHVSFYQRELAELKVMNAKYEKNLQSNQNEIESLNCHVQQLQQNYLVDISSKDELLRQYENELKSANEYILNLEQKYFYSLFLGVKLNMALYGGIEDLLENDVDPGRLYFELKDAKIGSENWPSWVSKKLHELISHNDDLDD